MISEYYVTVDTVEEDGTEWNHLLKMVLHGKEYLISTTTTAPLGQVGTHLWVRWTRLVCDNVTTLEQRHGYLVSGRVKLCTAFDVEENCETNNCSK